VKENVFVRKTTVFLGSVGALDSKCKPAVLPKTKAIERSSVGISHQKIKRPNSVWPLLRDRDLAKSEIGSVSPNTRLTAYDLVFFLAFFFFVAIV